MIDNVPTVANDRRGAAVTVSGLAEQQPLADGTRRLVLLDLDVPEIITVYLYASRG